MKKNENFAVTATVIGILFGAACAGCLWAKELIGFLVCGYAAIFCFAVAAFHGAKLRKLW